MLWTLINFVITNLIVWASFIYMPITRREQAFFGTHVSLDTYNSVGRSILKRYWFWVTLTFIQIQLLGWGLLFYNREATLIYTISLPLFALAGMIFYLKFAQQVQPFQVVAETQRFASALRVRHISEYTNIGWELIIALTIMIPIGVLSYYYPLLPDSIPMHWDLTGKVNRWAHKSFGSVFFLPILMIYLQGMFFMIKHGMLQTKMTLPANHAAEYLELKEEHLKITMQLLDKIRLLQSFTMGCISIMVLMQMLSKHSTIAPILILTFSVDLITLIICGQNIYRFMQIDDQLKSLAGTVYVQRERDAKHWYGGGLIYYNPDDPALFVEKLVGFGYTLNLANKRVYLYLGYFALLPLLMYLINL